MATITFEDGTKVNFSGTPTPKDVEEVASQLKLSKTGSGVMPSKPAPTPTTLGSKAKTLTGSLATGLGAKLPAVALDYAGKKVVNAIGTDKMKQNLATAPTLSQKYDSMFDIDKNPVTAKVGEVTGTVAGLAVPIKAGVTAIRNIPSVAKGIIEKKTGQLAETAGNIIQGDLADIPRAQKAFNQIETKGIETYKDLQAALDTKITEASTMLDNVLNTSPVAKKTGDLVLKTKVGKDTVAHNYADDAFGQLKAHYTATNDIENLAKIQQLKQKADSVGLTVKELNDLAKLHGRDLNAFNANGQAASGLTKQAAENTRTGLKATARDLFGNKIYKQTDEGMSDLIRTRELVEKMAEKVNDLQQRVQNRGFGEKVGRLMGTVINTIGLNSPKGFVEYFLGRGSGLKTMNALDLEKSLAKNLKKLQELADGNLSEEDLVKRLQAFIQGSGLPKKPSLK